MNFDFGPTSRNPAMDILLSGSICSYEKVIDAIKIMANRSVIQNDYKSRGSAVELKYHDIRRQSYTVKALYMIHTQLSGTIVESMKAGTVPLLVQLYYDEFSKVTPVLSCVMEPDACYIYDFRIKGEYANTIVSNINGLLDAAGYQEPFFNDSRNTVSRHAFQADEDFDAREGRKQTFDVSNTITVGYRGFGNEAMRYKKNSNVCIPPEDIYNEVMKLSMPEIYDLIVNYKVFSRELFLCHCCYGLRVYNSWQFMDIFQPWFKEHRERLLMLSRNVPQHAVEEYEMRFNHFFLRHMEEQLLGNLEELTNREAKRLWHDHQCWPLLYTEDWGDVVLQAVDGDMWQYKPLTEYEFKTILLEVKHHKDNKPFEMLEMTDTVIYEPVRKITLIERIEL